MRMTEVPKWRRQAGFTIIELMVAMTVGMILLLVASGLFFDALRVADSMLNQAQLNRQAREMFDLLALGGYRRTVNDKLGTVTTVQADVDYNYLFGLRGRIKTAQTLKSGWNRPSKFMTKTTDVSHTSTYRLALSPNEDESYNFSDSVVLSSDEEAAVTLTCISTTDPVGDCTGTTATVTGNLRIEPAAEARTVPNIQTIALELINAKYYEPGRAMENEVTSVYWTAFTNLIEVVP